MWSTVSDADQQRLVAPKKVKVISEKLKGRTFCVVAKTEEWQVEVVRRQKQIWAHGGAVAADPRARVLRQKGNKVLVAGISRRSNARVKYPACKVSEKEAVDESLGDFAIRLLADRWCNERHQLYRLDPNAATIRPHSALDIEIDEEASATGSATVVVVCFSDADIKRYETEWALVDRQVKQLKAKGLVLTDKARADDQAWQMNRGKEDANKGSKPSTPGPASTSAHSRRRRRISDSPSPSPPPKTAHRHAGHDEALANKQRDSAGGPSSQPTPSRATKRRKRASGSAAGDAIDVTGRDVEAGVGASGGFGGIGRAGHAGKHAKAGSKACDEQGGGASGAASGASRAGHGKGRGEKGKEQGPQGADKPVEEETEDPDVVAERMRDEMEESPYASDLWLSRVREERKGTTFDPCPLPGRDADHDLVYLDKTCQPIHALLLVREGVAPQRRVPDAGVIVVDLPPLSVATDPRIRKYVDLHALNGCKEVVSTKWLEASILMNGVGYYEEYRIY